MPTLLSCQGEKLPLSEECLDAELAKMMVHVQVAPPEPRLLGHGAEQRVRVPLEIPRLRSHALQQRLELRDVGRELAWPGA